MANFEQAIIWLRNGKKIRMDSWLDKEGYIKEGEYFDVVNKEGEEINLSMVYLNANNWEIYEKEFNLSDKFVDVSEHTEEIIKVKDVKEFIRRLKELVDTYWKHENCEHCNCFKEEIDKLAGDKLKW